jgi:hypothetical protein
MKWVTRERPVIDRIACPWLIAKFIDKDPEFLTYLWTFLVGVAVGAWLNELTNGPSRRPLKRR